MTLLMHNITCPALPAKHENTPNYFAERAKGQQHNTAQHSDLASMEFIVKRASFSGQEVIVAYHGVRLRESSHSCWDRSYRNRGLDATPKQRPLRTCIVNGRGSGSCRWTEAELTWVDIRFGRRETVDIDAFHLVADGRLD